MNQTRQNAFCYSKATIIQALNSHPTEGLSGDQLKINREQYGSNTLTPPKSESVFKRIWEAATEPIIALLFVAGFIDLAVNIYRAVTGTGANYLEVVGIFTAILFSVMVDVVIEGRSAKAFEALSQINDNTVVQVIRHGAVSLVKVMDVTVGDVLILNTGDKLPADGRLLESADLMVDESALTGESEPVAKSDQWLTEDEACPLAERRNMVYSGTYITGGHGQCLITAVGDDTEMGSIAAGLRVGKRKATPLQARLNRLGRNITIFGCIAALLCFTIQMISFYHNGTLTPESMMSSFVVSIVLIVAAAPEGLPTIVAVSLSINVIKLARQNTLVKKMVASETVGCINVICSDKTGTLTENKMAVKGFYTLDDQGQGRWSEAVNDFDHFWMAHNICLNTTADLDPEGGFIGNPSECAMLTFYEKTQGRSLNGFRYPKERQAHQIIDLFPFSSDLKHMTTIADMGHQPVAYVKGSPECVLSMCCLSPEASAAIESGIQAAAEKAMRVIAFAHKPVDGTVDYHDEKNHREMESHLVFDGLVAIADPLRPEISEAVALSGRAGIGLKILTGDNIITAKAIAQSLNLLKGEMMAVEASEIQALSDAALMDLLPRIAVIARSTPAIKQRVVSLLKEQGHVVAVTGDGINDAPALKSADVGIAMGVSGTEVAKEASDIVLLNDSFLTILKAVEWGRNIYENFKRFISFQLTVNIAAVICVFASIILGYETPFTALQMLWINIIMDGIPALTLGLEPNYEDLMNRPPVGRQEEIIDKNCFIRIFLTALYVSAFVLGQYFLNYLQVPESQMLTTVFAMFIIFHLFNAFNCRELHQQSIFVHLTGNRLMLMVMAVTFVLQVFFTQFAGEFFHTVPLSFESWFIIFALGSTVVLLSESIRWVMRRHQKKD